MFIMMNAARLGVGLQGLAQGEVAYQNAVLREGPPAGPGADRRAERDGRQGRPIIVHPDVRRMLMEAQGATRRRARWSCGVRCRSICCAARRTRRAPAARRPARLLTPVIKGYVTDKGFEAAVNMQQVFGGHGYIREWGMEQFVRDARIAQIYEGTNGIQALDLVGRKLAQGWRPRGASPAGWSGPRANCKRPHCG
jgi:alkylation response protein AidB-like acyl-CoA dehydrogenase